MNAGALISNLVLAIWLFISAFVLPHGQATAWNSIIVAIALVAVAFLVYASPGRPGLRFLGTVLAVWLFSATMLLPHLTLSTVANDVLVALAIAIVSLVPPHRWAIHRQEERSGHAPAAPG